MPKSRQGRTGRKQMGQVRQTGQNRLTFRQIWPGRKSDRSINSKTQTGQGRQKKNIYQGQPEKQKGQGRQKSIQGKASKKDFVVSSAQSKEKVC
jgi:hypothetical protein